MTTLVSKLCGILALGGMIWLGTTSAPNEPIDRLDQLDAERARRHLVAEGYEDAHVYDIDRWLTARHGCRKEKSVAVQVWAHDAYGTVFNLVVCCDEATNPNSCAVVRATP